MKSKLNYYDKITTLEHNDHKSNPEFPLQHSIGN